MHWSEVLRCLVNYFVGGGGDRCRLFKLLIVGTISVQFTRFDEGLALR